MDGKNVGRKIATQHRLLKSLFEGLGTALSAHDDDSAQRRTAGLRRALDAHFLLEEEHYFPRVRDEQPDRETDLQRLVEDHLTMRSCVEQVSAQLDRAEWEAAARTFNDLRARFQRHEASEREIVGS
jgi:hemerythrin superfamily protein